MISICSTFVSRKTPIVSFRHRIHDVQGQIPGAGDVGNYMLGMFSAIENKVLECAVNGRQVQVDTKCDVSTGEGKDVRG